MADNDKQTIFGFPVASIGFVNKDQAAEIARLKAELDEANTTVDKLRDARSRQANVIDDMGTTIGELRTELAAMTARKDGYRRVARMYRRELIEYVIEKQNENEVNAMYSTPDEVMKRNFIGWFSRRRREARNG